MSKYQPYIDETEVFDGEGTTQCDTDCSLTTVRLETRIMSILERIIRTHPIWYLPELNRFTVGHLLKNQNAGAFIVRQSSKANAMALSIRLPTISSSTDQSNGQSNQSEEFVDHYIIENTVAGVHLEGSPNYFTDLPFLLTHYTAHGEEIHVPLTLPIPLLHCGRKELVAFVALRKEFWTLSSRIKTNGTTVKEKRSYSVSSPDESRYSETNESNATVYCNYIPKTYNSTLTGSFDQSIAVPESAKRKKVRSHSSSNSNTPSTTPNVLSFFGPPNDDLFENHSVPVSRKRSDTNDVSQQNNQRKTSSEMRNRTWSTSSNAGVRLKNWLFSSEASKLGVKENQSPKYYDNAVFDDFSITPPKAYTDITVEHDDITINNNEDQKSISKPTTPNNDTSTATSSVERRFQTFKPSTALINNLESTDQQQNNVTLVEINDSAADTVTKLCESDKYYRSPVKPSIATKPQFINRSKTSPDIFETHRAPTKLCTNGSLKMNNNNRYRGQQKSNFETPVCTETRVTAANSDVVSAQTTEPSLHLDRAIRPSPAGLIRGNTMHELVLPETGASCYVNSPVARRRFGRKFDATPPQSSTAKAVRVPTPVVNATELNSTLRAAPSLGNRKAYAQRHSYRKSAPCLADSTSVEHHRISDMLRELKVKNESRFAVGELHTINENLPSGMKTSTNKSLATQSRHTNNISPSFVSHLQQPPTSTNITNDVIESISNTDSGFDTKSCVERSPMPPAPRAVSPAKPTTLKPTSFSRAKGSVQMSASMREPNIAASSLRRTASQRQKSEAAFHSETNFRWVMITDEMKRMQSKQKLKSSTNNQKRVKTEQSEGSQLNTDSSKVGRCSPPASINKPVVYRSSSDRFRNNKQRRQGLSTDSDYAVLSDFSDCFSYGGVSNAIGNNTAAGACDAPPGDDNDDSVSQTGTVFCEPWDSSVWENLLSLVNSSNHTQDDDSTADNTVLPPVELPSSHDIQTYASQIEEMPELLSPSDTEISEIAQATVESPDFSEKVRQWKENNLRPASSDYSAENNKLVRNSDHSDLPQLVAPSTPAGSPKVLPRARFSTLNKFSSLVPVCQPDSSIAATSSSNQSSAPTRNTATTSSETSAARLSPFRIAHVRSPARLHHSGRRSEDPSLKIQDYVSELSQDVNCIFGQTIQNFMTCTREAHVTDPSVIIGNVRQFMNGIKNYLVKHGEGQLHEIIENERSKLEATEFLNIDAILEGVLNKIVLSPLKPYLYQVLIKDSTSIGSLQVISNNLLKVRALPICDIGIEDGDGCTKSAMDGVRTALRRMQHHYSPLKKLEHLLKAVAFAYFNTCDERVAQQHNLPGAEELISWFVYILCRCGTVGCEVEATYMRGLLHPALLAGEATYFLHAFSTAIHLIKHPHLLHRVHEMPSDQDDGFIKVAIPDFIAATIRYQSFPSLPGMNSIQFCKMIAHKFKITNPEDYGLYLLIDGFETCLGNTDQPQMIKNHIENSGKSLLFAYKRHDAKIAWPQFGTLRATPKQI